ncbi:MAG: ATP-binding protein [Bacilli bacterium]|nr:ATP-binding protein [Bacilli bacterium]
MKRVTFITGHYGSGKSEFSVNLAIQKGIKNIVDLDIVNPYFRSRELDSIFSENKIKLISSTVDNSLGSDLPYISKEAYTLIKGEETVIYDLGGDPVGAKILRQFVDSLDLEEVDLLLCINVYREQTSTVDKILKMITDIESSGGIRINGLINNSNFIRDTVYNDLVEAESIIKEVSKIKNLDIIYTGVYENIIDSCGPLVGEVIPLKLYLRKKWL